MPRRSLSRKSRPISAGTLLVVVVCMALEWILFVAGLKFHEMLVGAVAVAASAVFIWRALQVTSEPLDLRLGDIAIIWRLPGMVASDAWTVTVVLLKDLFGVERAPSIYRATGFRTSNRDQLLLARTVLATIYTTCTPNSIVIGIDPAKSRMLAHQLKLTPPSKLEQELGRQG